MAIYKENHPPPQKKKKKQGFAKSLLQNKANIMSKSEILIEENQEKPIGSEKLAYTLFDASMYGKFTYSNLPWKVGPDVDKYAIHGWYG